MEGNIKMNSLTLQTNFYSIYKNFFNTHDTVLSGNAILTWGVDISGGMNILRIKQKLPTKTFCGVNFNNSGKVTFRNMLHYSALDNSFQEDSFDSFFKHDTAKIDIFLKQYLVDNGCFKGIEIDFLTEAPRGHGFAFLGAISTLLSLLLHIATDKISIKTLSNGELPMDHPQFQEIFQLSMRLLSYITRKKNVGASNYTMMVTDNSLPIVYVSQGDNVNPTNTENKITNHTFIEEPIINNPIYKNTLLNFLGIDNTTVPELPLDYGIIFTGIKYTFDEIESMRKSLKNENTGLDSFIHNIINSLPIQKEDRMILSDLLNTNIDQSSENIINSTNLRILESFNHLLKNVYDDDHIDAFINAIRKIGLFSFSYQKDNKIFFAIQYLFHQFKQFEDEEIGILPFNSGKIGGSLLFVMKNAKSRVTIEKVLSHLKENNKYIASLDYASWRDGYSSDGIRIEQSITQKLYSNYTKEGNVLFTDNFGRSYFGDYDSVIENEKNCILLDTIGGRIYIRGTKLTSKEIHSQNTTIDMMKLLLENIGKEVSNTKLPVSTYSQNKNEILSKIILPIRKLAKSYFGTEIPLICSGGITDYYLRLEQDESIHIGIIKKIQY